MGVIDIDNDSDSPLPSNLSGFGLVDLLLAHEISTVTHGGIVPSSKPYLSKISSC